MSSSPMTRTLDATAPSVPTATDDAVYRYLILDSGPIIKLTGVTTLWRRAQELYTVPAVLAEIRDAKAREHLEQLPLPLKTRHPSAEAIQTVTAFSRQTGDYQSLSSTDIQVLALVIDLEREASSGNMEHVRTTPQRVLGLGPMQTLGNKQQGTPKAREAQAGASQVDVESDEDDEDESESGSSDDDSCVHEIEGKPVDDSHETERVAKQASSWAKIVNPTASSPKTKGDESKMPIAASQIVLPTNDASQFADAEDDPLPLVVPALEHSLPAPLTIEEELELTFPSLAAAATVPMEGDQLDEDPEQCASLLEKQLRLEEERKKEALKPISKSGKLYNSFTRYGDLLKPKPVVKNTTGSLALETTVEVPAPTAPTGAAASDQLTADVEKSRIFGGSAFAGQDDDVEDDGEGWITTKEEITTMRAAGMLDPMRSTTKGSANSKPSGPPPSERAACATTDFAMQNVLLQMNLELLSVDGMRVRKLKSWVTRCGACYKIFTNTDNLGPLKSKRLFCSHCGSDFLQRIACSVDGKTGRLRLHFSKRYKNNLRGTKFSLPKPNTGNRFQGDLLLREDQLLMGAWNQKVKKMSGSRSREAAESIFGKDIATNVGCKATAVSLDDIRVGFGRRNPNAAKGRERRGKKKKTTDKACGLRRY